MTNRKVRDFLTPKRENQINPDEMGPVTPAQFLAGLRADDLANPILPAQKTHIFKIGLFGWSEYRNNSCAKFSGVLGVGLV